MSKLKCHIKKGDTVVVIAGEDKGKSGKVLQVVPQNGRALVEGVNIVKKHMQKTQENPQGGIVEMEASIAISNLKVSK
ncbi:MAG: 50S ribosomal protein L24 [Pontiellaceae bacterium]|nr:50S ribosomal protein L24 [Pontiellaceae bacterium]MBN2784749.1 50S ribosomal protein L24 [Pontiellaceae bacterium]